MTRFVHQLRMVDVPGRVLYVDEHGTQCAGRLDVLLIRKAWQGGCSFEDLADGFGRGLGTMGDWSAIRDSSEEATERMLERSLNFFQTRRVG